jgi:hypothetical protein
MIGCDCISSLRRNLNVSEAMRVIIIIIYLFRTRGTYHVQCIKINLRMRVCEEKKKIQRDRQFSAKLKRLVYVTQLNLTKMIGRCFYIIKQFKNLFTF